MESIAIHRQADKAELRGTVAQDLQLRAVVGHERVQRNVGHALFPAPDPFPGGHAGDVGESQPLGAACFGVGGVGDADGGQGFLIGWHQFTVPRGR
ncbi:hypothetical protein AHiyo1_28980 [Arthrobacter sp. Hiyo1]|nr:hypothetical protein AHiyo1_28980 [Arthrobacter sp. Hiyo1]